MGSVSCHLIQIKHFNAITSMMDVLVYDGPEALKSSVTHSVATLQAILLPQYTVQTITPHILASQPWKNACTLFVLPQCHTVLQTANSTTIKDYVESGGSLLVFGAGAFHSDRDQDGAAAISKGILLSLFDKSIGAYLHILHGGKDIVQKTCTLRGQDEVLIEGIRGANLDRFTGIRENISSVLAQYSEGGEGSIAAIAVTAGRGKSVIWAPNIEAPLSERPDVVEADRPEKKRLDLLRKTLGILSIRLPETEETPVMHPLPQYLTSSPNKGHIISKIAEVLAAPSPGSQLSTFKDENDTFDFHHLSESEELIKNARANSGTSNEQTEPLHKHVILCPNILPDLQRTPLFDLHGYYNALSKAREEQKCIDEPDSWGCGEALLYGEVVTSTQTMLDKNPRLLSLLPTPFVSLASYQLSGRGRGSNIWLSPKGCLQFSVLQRAPLSSFPASKLVFVQYLFALAVVGACHDDTILGKRGRQVRLKWPNDIYAVVDGEQKKVGGILVNTNFSGGMVDIVIGCGLNVLNAAPIFSLMQLLPLEERHVLTLERTAASILAKFEKMWETFVRERGSFDQFMDLYIEKWLHSDQLITVTTVTPHQQVRVVGITSDHGLLRTIPEKSGKAEAYIDLQPDGNSFDMMAGLIKSKT